VRPRKLCCKQPRPAQETSFVSQRDVSCRQPSF
jgi:hypothetical protein